MTANKLVLEKISEEQGVAWLTFNCPEKKNALSRALLRELASSLKALRQNDKIRCIVTTGAGDCYSSGRDLKDMKEQASQRRRWGAEESAAEIVTLLHSCPQVTIAAVKGYCLGGGISLLNAHDLAVSSDTAIFGMPEVIRGSYGATATPTLFHAGIPLKKAFYIQLTGRNLSGEEAEKVGLVSKVVPEKDFIPFVEKLALEIGSRNPVTLAHAKIAAYLEKDVDINRALMIDDLVAHRMRFYTNPLSDVDGYLKSQKGGGSLAYKKPEKE